MRIVNLDSWSDFEKNIEKKLQKEMEFQLAGPIVYRGHADANWPLMTTLERYINKHLSVRSYYNIIKSVQSKIETFTDRKWDLPSYQDFIKAYKERPSAQDSSTYFYMTYLRHFGFPSPFLDWSYSPYVAAFFAFRDVSSTAKSIAIYEYFAHVVSFQECVSEKVEIFPLAKSSQKNRRHELQQSFYTVCLREVNGEVYYESHESQQLMNEKNGAPITKYILPASERLVALQKLEAYNINAYSLFGSEESLLESLFTKIYKNAKVREKTTALRDDEIW
ncbi:MAG: FRG domain-containing protein [Anaerolineales bacterium]